MTTPRAEESFALPSYARIGDVLAGKYCIERVLGRGGMGIVVAASHVKLRQPVAIKFLLPSSLGEPQLGARLLREARAAAALKGEHIARVFDVDTVEGAPYIVMEYLEGRTLAAFLETNGPLTPTLAVDYALEACEALAEAHALGIVHRDLKPSNLFLARSPGGRQTLRVLDFGISKALGGDYGEANVEARKPAGSQRDLATFSGTDSHALVGSPPYVSPEQLMRPREADARSDIWSLGVVLFQCLTGRLPFQGETLTRLWDSIVREPMPPIATSHPGVSPELERIVGRCLEKDPGLRYADVPALARELGPLGSARGRASLEVIDALAVNEPGALRAAQSAEANGILPERGATLTEAPTTRERTPSVNVTLPAGRSRPRAGMIAASSAALAGWLFFATREGPPARSEPSVPTPVPLAASAPPTEPLARTPDVKPVASGTADRTSQPAPRSSGPIARPAPVRRENSGAEALADSAASRSETAPVDVLARAEELLGAGQISEACAVGQVAAASAPNSPRVLEFLGRCYMRLGSVEQARAYYRRYLELAPSAPNAAFVRAMLEPKPP